MYSETHERSCGTANFVSARSMHFLTYTNVSPEACNKIERKLKKFNARSKGCANLVPAIGRKMLKLPISEIASAKLFPVLYMRTRERILSKFSKKN